MTPRTHRAAAPKSALRFEATLFVPGMDSWCEGRGSQAYRGHESRPNSDQGIKTPLTARRS